MLAFVIGLLFTVVVYAETNDNGMASIEYDSKISVELQQQMKRSNDTIKVMAWLNDIDMDSVRETALSECKLTDSNGHSKSADNTIKSLEDATLEETQAFIMKQRSLAKNKYLEQNTKVADELFGNANVLYVSKYSPVVLVELTATDIRTKSTNENIVKMCYYSENDEDAVEKDIAMQIIRADEVASSPYYGQEGTGIIVGIYEGRLIDDVSEVFPDVNVIEQSGTPDDDDANHPVATLEMLSSIAPKSDYYIACGSNYLGAIEWLIENGANVINASRRIGDTAGNRNSYSDTAKWLDHIACQHYVHFVKSAGNKGAEGVTNGAMAFNIITVGGFEDNNTTTMTSHTVCSSSSYFAYNKRNSTNRRYAQKPDICVPSVGIGLDSFETSTSGTSIAAPQVSGAVALLCEQTPELLTKPDAVKAILQASVLQNHPFNGVPDDSQYEKHGAGVLDVMSALWVANYNRFERSYFMPSETDATNTHTFSVSAGYDSVRISLVNLVWTEVTGIHSENSNAAQTIIPDLSIKVYGPGNTTTAIAESSVTYGNVEIVEFDVTTPGTYTVEVIKTGASTLRPTYYSIAWRKG